MAVRILSRRRNDQMSPAGAAVRVLALLACAVFFGLPLLWILLAPTKNDAQLIDLAPLAVGPLTHIVEVWQHLLLFNDGEIVIWARNSVLYVLASLLLSLMVSVPAGYALATARFVGRNLILWLTLITMILPGSALVLPLFLEMNLVHLVNTPYAVILPAAFFPFGMYLAFIYYTVSLPPDLLAAARVDGASELQLFLHVGLPLARPLLGLLTFLSFTANWNNYFLPFVMLNDDRLFNLPVGIQALMSGTSAMRPTFATDLPIKRPEVALAGLILVVPVALVFLLSQRFVVSGALTGATKE
jgi:multiple sugar transport system permease protein